MCFELICKRLKCNIFSKSQFTVKEFTLTAFDSRSCQNWPGETIPRVPRMPNKLDWYKLQAIELLLVLIQVNNRTVHVKKKITYLVSSTNVILIVSDLHWNSIWQSVQNEMDILFGRVHRIPLESVPTVYALVIWWYNICSIWMGQFSDKHFCFWCAKMSG